MNKKNDINIDNILKEDKNYWENIGSGPLILTMIYGFFYLIIGIILMVIDLIFSTQISTSISDNIGPWLGIPIIVMSGLMITFIIGVSILLRSLLYILKSRVNATLRILESTENLVETIAEILSRIQKIHTLVWLSQKIGSIYGFIGSKKGQKIVNLYLENIRHTIISALINLKDDLTVRLNEEVHGLNVAKSSVMQDIRGSNQLEEIKKLQIVRLDYQIRQFEQLKKILSKG